MYDLIIIGSGPAGLSAAVYGKRAGLDTLVLEKNPMSGGQVLTTYEVDNYLGMPGIDGFAMGTQFREHADKLGAAFMETEVIGLVDCGNKKIVKTTEGDLEAKAVIVATGASHRHLNVPGEGELSGMGVSYCATCDGAFFRGRTVAVVGGGDVAVEDAIFLARACEKVYVVHRRNELRAAKMLQDKLFALPNVEMCWNCTVEEIKGTDQVEKLVLKDKTDDSKKELSVDGVFIAVGISPNVQAFDGFFAADQGGYIVAAEDCATNVPGFFAAGDVRTKKLRQIVTAVADGANAVAAVQEYLLTLS